MTHSVFIAINFFNFGENRSETLFLFLFFVWIVSLCVAPAIFYCFFSKIVLKPFSQSISWSEILLFFPSSTTNFDSFIFFLRFFHLIKSVREVGLHYFNFSVILFLFKKERIFVLLFLIGATHTNAHTQVWLVYVASSPAFISFKSAHNIVELLNIWNCSMVLNVLVTGSSDLKRNKSRKISFELIRVRQRKIVKKKRGKNRKLNKFSFQSLSFN